MKTKSFFRREFYKLYKHSNGKTYLNHCKTNLKSVHHVYIHDTEAAVNCMNYFPNATELTFESSLPTSCDSIANILNCIIPLKQLSKLVLECHRFSFMKLIQLLRFTPNIDTLQLASMLFYGEDYVSIQQSEEFQLLSNENRITKVMIKETCTLEKIQFLIALCPQMKCLTLRVDAEVLESVICFVLERTKKNSSHLHLLHFLRVNYDCYERLDIFMKSEKVLDDYMLKMVNQDMYIWW